MDESISSLASRTIERLRAEGYPAPENASMSFTNLKKVEAFRVGPHDHLFSCGG